MATGVGDGEGAASASLPRRRRRRGGRGTATLSALVVGAAALMVGCDGEDQTQRDTVDEPSPHVHLLPDGGTSAEVVVPSDGRLGSVLEVTDSGTPVLLSVTTGDAPLTQGQELMLIPADAEPEDLDTPIGEDPTGIPNSAWWRIRAEAPVKQVWLFLPEAPAQPYQLAVPGGAGARPTVPSPLEGTTLTLELHPVNEPLREDLVGSWEPLDLEERTLRFEGNGDFVVDAPEGLQQLERVGTWDYANGEIRYGLGEDLDAYRATLLPDGRLALVATDAERILDPPSGQMMVLTPIES